MFLRAIAAAAVTGMATFLPVIIFGLIKTHRPIVYAGLTGLAIFMADIFTVFSPSLFGIEGMPRAWCGKILVTTLAIVLCWKIVGNWSFFRVPSKTWLPVTLLVALLTTIPMILTDWESLPKSLSVNVFAYQALMPGIAEELIYRLLLLYVIDKALGRPIPFLGVKFGWGAVITTILFYGAHCVSFDNNWNLAIEYLKIPDYLIYGIAMCWLRYRFDSILPSIVAHNAYNVFLVSLPSVLRLMK